MLELKLCPACGQAMPHQGRDVHYHADGGIVTRVGYAHPALLTPSRGFFFNLLLQHVDHYVHREVLWNAKYATRPDCDQPTSYALINVYICQTRKLIRPLDLAIDTRWGFGWRLVVLARTRQAA